MYTKPAQKDGQDSGYDLVFLLIPLAVYSRPAIRTILYILRDLGAAFPAINIFHDRCSAVRAHCCGIGYFLPAFLAIDKCHS